MPSETTSRKIAVCTLADGPYLQGAAVLVNSLCRAGYAGEVWIGHRGPLPGWAGRAADATGTAVSANPNVRVRFVPVDGTSLLSAMKPRFALDVLDRLAPDADGVAFFDADIVAIADWPFFERWLDAGIGLCFDSAYPVVPDGHPFRHAWADLARTLGRPVRALDWYFNSGFVGVSRASREFLEIWRDAVDWLDRRQPGGIDRLKIGTRADPYWATDQDALNVAAMATALPLSPIGLDGMGFNAAGFVMLHAISQTKPWQGGYLRRALRGHPPARVDKEFWALAQGPLQPFNPSTVRYQRLAIRLASAIGRFYGRR